MNDKLFKLFKLVFKEKCPKLPNSIFFKLSEFTAFLLSYVIRV